jgi:hypothetical protein
MSTLTATAATFTRPANTTAYASGQLLANSIVAASVVPLSFNFDRPSAAIGAGFQIRRATIIKSGITVANAAFRLHLFTAAPTFITTGDAGVLATVGVGAASYLGSLDVTAMIAFSDGAFGAGVPLFGTELVVAPNYGGQSASGQVTLFGILEARGAYVPASGETFTVRIEAFPVAVS